MSGAEAEYREHRWHPGPGPVLAGFSVAFALFVAAVAPGPWSPQAQAKSQPRHWRGGSGALLARLCASIPHSGDLGAVQCRAALAVAAARPRDVSRVDLVVGLRTLRVGVRHLVRSVDAVSHP